MSVDKDADRKRAKSALAEILSMEKRLPDDFDPEKELGEARTEKYENLGRHKYHTGCSFKERAAYQSSPDHYDKVCRSGNHGIFGGTQYSQYILCATEGIFSGRETEVYQKSLRDISDIGFERRENHVGY